MTSVSKGCRSVVAILVVLGCAWTATAHNEKNVGLTTLEVVTIQNCSCMETGCTVMHPPSGTCSPDPLFPATNSRNITCMDQVQQCAQLINFNDDMCSISAGVFTAVCGFCQKLNANPNYYALPHCDPVTQAVTWDTGCNAGCTVCTSPAMFVHPFSTCSPALGGNGWTYNQGIQPCDAVSVSVFQSTTCAASSVLLDQFVVGQYACNFGEYFSCTPKNPTIPAVSGHVVVKSDCPWNGGSNIVYCAACPQVYVPAGTCVPAPPNFHNSHNISSMRAMCNPATTPAAMCADLVIHANTVCSMFVGRTTPVCGSCMMLGATSGPQGTYSKVMCNMTSQAVTISNGCNSDCSVCTLPGYITHNFLQCNAGDPNTTSTYNRGLFGCNTVQYTHYTDTQCSPQYAVHVELEAEGICQFDRMSQCVDRLVTFQNCSNPNVTVTTQENACVADPVDDTKHREYKCLNHVRECAQLVEFSDSACTQFTDAASLVCGACMKVFNPLTQQADYQQISCASATQQVSININCNANCSFCANQNVVVHPVGQCTHGLGPVFIRNEGLTPCDAVQIAVYSGPTCAAATLEMNFTIGQDQCVFDEFVQCTADELPVAPMGNELQLQTCTDLHCTYGCFSTAFTAGGCQANYQGRPGGHVVSCDAMESYCADLSVHNGATCGSFIGVFHPVCGSCFPMMNDTDPFGFVSIQCDSTSPTVVVSTGCDSQCANCTYPAIATHGYLQCSPDTLSHDRSIINRGVVPCATVSVTEYSDTSCMPSTKVASWHVARDFCDMGHVTTCAPSTIGIQNCTACNGNSTAATCNKTLVAEGACVPDPYASVVGGTRTVSCVPTWQQCVHLAIFTDDACTNYRTSVEAVCGQCNQLIEVDAQGNKNIVYASLSCNEAYNWISIRTHCNPDCSICNDTDTTLINNQCSATNYLGGVFNFGLHFCDAVQIQQYHTAGCTGAPVSTYMVGQDQCSFDEYYECSARPMQEPIRFTGKVIWRTCPNSNDVACMNCTTEVFASGGCVPKASTFGSRTVSCNGIGGGSTCANFAVHNDDMCTTFAGDHHPVCGQCFQLEGEANYTQLLCDPATQDVTIRHMCSQNCATCAYEEVHPYLSCGGIIAPPPNLVGKFFFNRGLMPCDTVTVTDYNSFNCDLSTQVASWQESTTACQFGHSVQCQPHLVHIQNCSCPTCAETVLTEGSCTLDQYGHYRKYQCFDQGLTCATLIQYQNSTVCEPPQGSTTARPDIIAGVCGACMKRPSNTDPNQFVYYLLQCDQDRQTVSFDGGCDANCYRCTQPNIEVHPFMQCSPGYEGSAIFNQGLRPCNGVQINVYTESSCTGSSMSWFEAGQRDCGEMDHLYIYCDANPTALPPDGGQVIMTMCPWEQGASAIKRVVEGDCTSGCQTYPVVDGACAPAPPFETRFVSHRVSCETQSVSTCADLILFNSTGCAQSSFFGIHTPVCGSCYQFGNDVDFTQVVCDTAMQQVSFNMQCNADCSQCASMGLAVQKLQCSPGHHPGTSVVSRGLFSCPTVMFTHYSSTNCAPGTSTGNMVVAQGICEFNQRLQCSKNLVTIQNCSCPTCAAAYSADSQCRPDAFGMYREYTCANAAMSCVNMGYFRDAACSQYADGYTVVCNTCWKQLDPFTGAASYNAVLCNATSQEVIMLTGCSDGSCSDCIGQQFTHPFNQCSRFMRGSSLFNTGIVPCDAVSVSVYSDSLCSTAAVDHWVQGQHFCAIDEYISCSAAPIVNPDTPNNALEYYSCPITNGNAFGYGCVGCSVAIEQSGGCYPSTDSGHFHSISCKSEMAFCAAFVVHNDSTCIQNYLGEHNPVCGSCAKWFDQTTYTQIVCDIFSQNVTASFGCNADCSVCTQTVTHAFMQCSQLVTQPAWTLLNRGIMPCSTVSLSEYTSSDCAASSLLGTYDVAQDLCQVGHKISCFNQPQPIIPGGNGGDGGTGAGAAVGITAGVLIAVFAAGLAAWKFKNRKVYRTVDPQWSAMNEGGAPTPSNVQGSYGSLQQDQ